MVSQTTEPTYTINWRVHFDDDSMIAECSLLKHKRQPTDDEWPRIYDGQDKALDLCAGLLKEEFDLVVNPDDTVPHGDGGLTGTCQATKDAIAYIFSHEDMNRNYENYKEWFLETCQTLKTGPAIEAFWSCLHDCDCLVINIDGFPEELVDEYRSRKTG